MFEWDKAQARELRLRLGWSQADLARRLHIQVQEVIKWENGDSAPTDQILSDIEFLLRQADICSEEVLKAPLIEIELEQSRLTQLNSESVTAPQTNDSQINSAHNDSQTNPPRNVDSKK